jgi:hypothetical protein
MIRPMAASARSNCLRLAGNAFARIRRTVLAQRRAAPFSRLERFPSALNREEFPERPEWASLPA